MLTDTLALIALLAPALPAHADTPLFEITSRRTIFTASFVPVTPAAPVVAPLALVVEDGSRWDGPGVLEGVLGKASAIFARCGVTLGDAEVVTVRWSAEGLKRLNDQDPYHGPAQMGVMGEPLIPKRRRGCGTRSGSRWTSSRASRAGTSRPATALSRTS